MKNLLVLCAKNVHFIFINNIYLLKGGVTVRYLSWTTVGREFYGICRRNTLAEN